MQRRIYFPTFDTKRLVLRALLPTDAEDLYEMRHDDSTHRFTDTLQDHHIEATKKYIAAVQAGISQEKWYAWSLVQRETGKIIGLLSLWQFNMDELTAEIGCMLHPDYRGQGYMREAIGAILRFAHDMLGLSYLDAFTERQNYAAQQMLTKAGFSVIDQMEEAGALKERVFQMMIYRKSLIAASTKIYGGY